MTNESAINRLLYAILSQKCLKDIDWNKVASDPILAQEITNGHAARMRYSRFKKQMDGTTSMPTRPRQSTVPRRSKVDKKNTPKREPKIKSRRESRNDPQFQSKTEPNDLVPRPEMEQITNIDASTLFLPKIEASATPPPTFKIKTEPSTPSSCSRLSTPFLLSNQSSPDTPTFPTPGVVSLNSSMSSNSTCSSLNDRMMDTSLFGSPLCEQQLQLAYKARQARAAEMEHSNHGQWGMTGTGFRDAFTQDKHLAGGDEGGNMVLVKREAGYEGAYGYF